NSPLLDDSEIKGARWLLININSAEGEHEFTMDEVEIIQNYILSQAGEDTDVILGMGYDSSLEDKIGITLIATGFESKDFTKASANNKVQQDAEKIVLVLEDQKKQDMSLATPVVSNISVQSLTPVLNNEENVESNTEEKLQEEVSAVISETVDTPEVFHLDIPVLSLVEIQENNVEEEKEAAANPVVNAGYLTPPAVIYEEENIAANVDAGVKGQERTIQAPVIEFMKEEDEIFNMQLVEKDVTEIDQTSSKQVMFMNSSEDQGVQDEEEEQRRKATERLQKLRNLSFNIYGTDSSNDFDTVPAYLRRNLELYSTISPAENFYSNYTVKSDENNNTHISSMNSFLDGNKPD
ncbi:MAG: cell division protein FtsZ, partial [Bacteroidota bacterium]